MVLPVNVISLCLQSSSASRVTAGRGDRGRDRRVAPRPVEAVAPRFELSQRSIEGLAQNEEPGLESRQRTAMSRREAAMTAFAKSWWRE